jgi:hypothetical protein
VTRRHGGGTSQSSVTPFPSHDRAAPPTQPTAAPPADTPPAPEDIGTIIVRARKESAAAEERCRQERAEAMRREAPLLHLLSAWRYTSPTGRTTDP